ncbi:hypothetical protein MJO28_007226 [Puccinia striiformis f. sp. tritici]|uniref:Uncharacterized protein n=1 Tax=Puccinia striiformis f. sp. tritici TaxID=168172 RepID=A0ACC0EDE1_9BASI|nr:hypothetical protein MJO28_007226 [Puccinia striiformis f. sp. tritici]
MTNKLDQVCTLLRGLNLTPKRFMIALSEEDDNNAAVSQHYCRTERGWDSTERLILCFKTRHRYALLGFICPDQDFDGFLLDRPLRLCVHKSHKVAWLQEALTTTCPLWRMDFFQRQRRWLGTKNPVKECSDEDEKTNSSNKLADLDGSVLKRSRNPAVRRTNWVQTLCYPLELLKLKSGAQVVHQSHKNKISLVLLNNFCHMAKSECMGESPPSGLAPQAIADCYLAGMCKLQHEFTKNGLARFWPYCPGIKAMEEADRMTKEQM